LSEGERNAVERFCSAKNFGNLYASDVPVVQDVLRRLSTTPESGAVAWQWRSRNPESPLYGKWRDCSFDEPSDRELLAASGAYDFRPLYAHPSPGVAGVSEAVLDKAEAAYTAGYSLTPRRERLRAALTAALSAKESKP
jgi:hypothetical protein